jgi:thioesterase domain-containing protein
MPRWIWPIAVHRQSGLALAKAKTLSVQQLATVIADELADMKSGAAVAILGWCYGGVVAIELASQLKCRGYAVLGLFVAESKAPLRGTAAYGVATCRNGATGFFRNVDVAVVDMSKRIKNAYMLLRHRPLYWFYLWNGRKLPHGIIERELIALDARCERQFRFCGSVGDLVLIWTRFSLEKKKLSRTPWSFNPDVWIPRWKQLSTGVVSVVYVNGDHNTMLKGENGGQIAVELVKHIAKKL